MTEHPQNTARPYQILSSRRAHDSACAYCAIIIIIIIAINCITITLFIITFIVIPCNSLVSQWVGSAEELQGDP